MAQQELFTAPAETAMTTQATFISDNKSIVKQIWDKFWTNGFSNPMTAIEQFSYLIFMKQLDEEETRRVKMKVFRPQTSLTFEDKENLRWSFFKNIDDPVLLGKTVREAFDFVRTLGDAGGAYVKHMRGAIFLLSPEGGESALLGDLITLIDQLRFDTSGEGEDEENLSDQGDLYEFMLSQLTSSGKNGQFRTPRHIINLMVEMMAPRPQVVEEGKPYRICDPSCGTGGFLISAASYVKKLKLTDETGKETRWMTKAEHSKLFEQMLVGYDFDATMLRIASMNLMLHGVSDPTVEGINSVSQSAFEAHDLSDSMDLILANPPFKGSVDIDEVAGDLLKAIGKTIPKKQGKTKPTVKTELLFVALILQMLKVGGRAAVIVPDGVLFGSSKSHKKLRETVVENHRLEAVISMPSGVFKPYAGVSTAILIFTKMGVDKEGTDQVWFYEMEADGFSLDDKRNPIEENDLPDLKSQWAELKRRERAAEKLTSGKRTSKAFFVLRSEIAENGYDLSINRYKEVVYEEVEYEAPKVILERLKAQEAKIMALHAQLEELLG